MRARSYGEKFSKLSRTFFGGTIRRIKFEQSRIRNEETGGKANLFVAFLIWMLLLQFLVRNLKLTSVKEMVNDLFPG